MPAVADVYVYSFQTMIVIQATINVHNYSYLAKFLIMCTSTCTVKFVNHSATISIAWLERPKLVCRPCNETLHDEYKYNFITFFRGSYSTN